MFWFGLLWFVGQPIEKAGLLLALVCFSLRVNPSRRQGPSTLRMVLLHVKKSEEHQFLYETTVNSSVSATTAELCEVRLCSGVGRERHFLTRTGRGLRG